MLSFNTEFNLRSKSEKKPQSSIRNHPNLSYCKFGCLALNTTNKNTVYFESEFLVNRFNAIFFVCFLWVVLTNNVLNYIDLTQLSNLLPQEGNKFYT